MIPMHDISSSQSCLQLVCRVSHPTLFERKLTCDYGFQQLFLISLKSQLEDLL